MYFDQRTISDNKNKLSIFIEQLTAGNKLLMPTLQMEKISHFDQCKGPGICFNTDNINCTSVASIKFKRN